MPILNFKPQFVDPIREGRKNHTIRADRKHPIKTGDKLYLYCGLRRKGAYRILPEPVTCTKAVPISIDFRRLGTQFNEFVFIGEQRLSHDECEALARADGFGDWTAMVAFWEREHGDCRGEVRFSGQIIHWKRV